MKKTSMNQFFEGKKQEMMDGMHTARFCEILSVDMNLYKADILPLDDPDATPILDVPFGYQQTENFVIQMPYKKGDVVIAAFVERDMDPIMLGGGEPASRQFSDNDAVIMCGVNVYTKQLNNPHHDDVMIADKEFKRKIRIQPNGEIFLESDENINIISQKDVIIKGRNIFLN